MQGYTTEEINTRFDLLERYERRCVIYYLRENDTSHANLADVVSNLTKQDPTPCDADSIELSLRHIHLPKLASTGVLDFDSRSETVRYYGDELIDDLLDVTPEIHGPEP